MPVTAPIIVYQANNSPGKSDGALFKRSAETFASMQDSSILLPIDTRNSAASRRALIGQTIRAVAGHGYDSFVFFGHGGSTWIGTGHTLDTIHELAVDLAESLTHDAIIGLYTCLAGGGPDKNASTAAGRGAGSLADHLHQYLCQYGATYNRVLAHTTSGHVYENPYMIQFGPCGEEAQWVGPAPGVGGWEEWKASLEDVMFALGLPDDLIDYVKEIEPEEAEEAIAIGASTGTVLALAGLVGVGVYYFARKR